jgi:hypothetical protein
LFLHAPSLETCPNTISAGGAEGAVARDEAPQRGA